MQFHFCQDDHNKRTPAMSLILGYFMLAFIRDCPDTKLKTFNFERNEISCNTVSIYDHLLNTMRYVHRHQLNKFFLRRLNSFCCFYKS